MEVLINKTDVEKRVQVGIGYNDKNFQQFTREAQEFDLKPLLCEDFYMSLFSLSDPDKEKIFNGGEYEYNSKTYAYWGLSDVLSYFTYARFLMKSPIVSTTHGIVKKKTPESEPADLGERKNLYYKYRQEANQIFESFKKFAERTNLSNWNCSDEPCKEFKYKSNVIQ
jgi:hypothetical protein